MTCCSGSSVSSAAETMKVASFSSSLIVGSFLTSFSNCSSGTSSRTFLPSGPTAATSACSCSAVFAAPAFFPRACFLAGAFLEGAADFAAFAVVGDEGFLAAAFLAVELDELEDTNYLSVVVQGIFRNRRGRDKTRTCQQPRAHCGTTTKPRCVRSVSWSVSWSPSRGRLFLLLVRAHLLQRRHVHHVGDGSVA